MKKYRNVNSDQLGFNNIKSVNIFHEEGRGYHLELTHVNNGKIKIYLPIADEYTDFEGYFLPE